MNELILGIENLDLDDSKALLSKFISDNEKNSASPVLQDELRDRLWTVLFKQIDIGSDGKLLCLKTIRILSRDKTKLSTYITDDRLKKLLEISSINAESNPKDDCSIEALKCLCNITYNFPSASDKLNSYDTAFLLARRLTSYKGRKDVYEKKLFEIKLLFLITAFSISSRQMLYEKYGLNFFIDLCLDEGKIPKENIMSPKRKKISLGNDQIKVLSEILKTAFNVLINIKTEGTIKNEFQDFVAILRELIVVGLSPQSTILLSDAVNFLTLIPDDCLDTLMIPGQKWTEKNVDKCPSMEAVSVLIDFLDATLVKIEEVPGTPKEELSPILLVLTNLSKNNRQYRKYIRTRVLPNLREIYTRPEVGSTLRNKLCRLLTCPITSTRDLVADFLFVLCKESVGRMVKYTGYGNAAGLFANRGLLGGDNKQRSSSESEDSETEEYSQHKHMINPIVGCLTPPRVDETKNMTEEQKEYLAMELVNKLDKLQREGIFQPCFISSEGTITPVGHVLELQENASLPLDNSK